ncbi:hypothetical protein E2P81_ATG11653 [Venturia nashicola]|nr:hypothetical protein E2P81_ATG11653 [Venturia nashicola]
MLPPMAPISVTDARDRIVTAFAQSGEDVHVHNDSTFHDIKKPIQDFYHSNTHRIVDRNPTPRKTDVAFADNQRLLTLLDVFGSQPRTPTEPSEYLDDELSSKRITRIYMRSWKKTRD